MMITEIEEMIEDNPEVPTETDPTAEKDHQILKEKDIKYQYLLLT
jgi:hypothetical protein